MSMAKTGLSRLLSTAVRFPAKVEQPNTSGLSRFLGIRGSTTQRDPIRDPIRPSLVSLPPPPYTQSSFAGAAAAVNKGFKRSVAVTKISDIKWESNWKEVLPIQVEDQKRARFCQPVQTATLLGYLYFILTGKKALFSSQAIVDGMKLHPMCNSNIYAVMHHICEHGLYTAKDVSYTAKRGNPAKLLGKEPVSWAKVLGFISETSSIEKLRSVLKMHPVLVEMKTNMSLCEDVGGVWDKYHRIETYRDHDTKKIRETSQYPDHMMIALDFGKDKSGGGWLLLQNGWGVDWGDNGFIIVSEEVLKSWGLLNWFWYPCLEAKGSGARSWARMKAVPEVTWDEPEVEFAAPSPSIHTAMQGASQNPFSLSGSPQSGDLSTDSQNSSMPPIGVHDKNQEQNKTGGLY